MLLVYALIHACIHSSTCRQQHLFEQLLGNMQAGMRLQPDQVHSIMLARQRLLKQVSAVRQAREKVVMAFGLAVIQRRPVSIGGNAYECMSSAQSA